MQLLEILSELPFTLKMSVSCDLAPRTQRRSQQESPSLHYCAPFVSLAWSPGRPSERRAPPLNGQQPRAARWLSRGTTFGVAARGCGQRTACERWDSNRRPSAGCSVPAGNGGSGEAAAWNPPPYWSTAYDMSSMAALAATRTSPSSSSSLTRMGPACRSSMSPGSFASASAAASRAPAWLELSLELSI